MQCAAQAENHNVVARQYDSVAAYKHAFVVAYKSGQCHVVGQLEFFYGFAGYLCTGMYFQFGHFGITECQAFGC